MSEILAAIRRKITEEEEAGAGSGESAGATGVGTAGSAAPSAPESQSDEHEEVLELTAALNEDGSVRELAPIGGSSRRPAAPATSEAAPSEPSPREEPAPASYQAAALSDAALRELAEPALPETVPDQTREPPPAAAVPAEGTEPDLPEAVRDTVEPALPETQPNEMTEPVAAAVRPRERSESAPAQPEDTSERLVSQVTSLAAAAAFARVAAAPRGRRPMQEVPMVGDRPLDEIVRELLRPLLQTWLDENLPAIVERLVAAELERIARRD